MIKLVLGSEFLTPASFSSSFTLGLACHLSELGTPGEIKERMLADYGEISFGNSNNRSIVGTMNQLALEYSFLIGDAGGINSPDGPDRVPPPVGGLIGVIGTTDPKGIVAVADR